MTVVGHVFASVSSGGPHKERMMLTLDVTYRRNAIKPCSTTLWHCSWCDAFISIRATHLIDDGLCPACGKLVLEFCGRINNIPWIEFGDA